jgi:uncharacterized protein
MTRHFNLDFIRGIAVLGLVYLNIYTFGIFELDYIPSSTSLFSDNLIEILSIVFLEGRFRTLFSMLFGIGLYIQWQRYQSMPVLKQRLKWLIIFGLIHGFLLWAGDILFAYGIAGWYIVKYLDNDSEQLLTRGIRYILLSGLVVFLILWGVSEPIQSRSDPEFIALYNERFGSILSVLVSNAIMNVYMLIMVPLATMWMCAGLMLIGIFLYKQCIFQQGLNAKQLGFCLVGFLFFVLLRLIAYHYNSGVLYAAQDLLSTLAALFMAIVYIHLAVKFCRNEAHHGVLIQTVGRFAFTLYICQTILQLMVFKWLFPRWIIEFDRQEYWFIATMLVFLQLIAAHIYSRYYSQGPLEYLWRKLNRVNLSINSN